MLSLYSRSGTIESSVSVVEKALVAGLKKTPNFYDQVIEKFMAVDRRAEFHFK
jgi:hypothetical protein